MSIQQSPLSNKRAHDARATEDEPRPAGPVRVLLAEDDLDLRCLLAGELRKEGFIVKEARSGFELLQHLADSALQVGMIDLIVSDIRMPGITGLSVVEGLRTGNLEARWETPVILITAFGDARTHAEADRLGVVLLDKPFDLDEFRARARQLVDPSSLS